MAAVNASATSMELDTTLDGMAVAGASDEEDDEEMRLGAGGYELAVRIALDDISDALCNGYEAHVLQRQPHLVLLDHKWSTLTSFKFFRRFFFCASVCTFTSCMNFLFSNGAFCVCVCFF